MNDEKRHVAVMLLFRVRFTYTVDNVPFSRIALVKASSPHSAKEYIASWLKANNVTLPNFQFRSVTRCTDFSYIIDPDSFRDRLPSVNSADPSRPRVLSMQEELEFMGEFTDVNQPTFF